MQALSESFKGSDSDIDKLKKSVEGLCYMATEWERLREIELETEFDAFVTKYDNSDVSMLDFVNPWSEWHGDYIETPVWAVLSGCVGW